jgi:predicted nuclease of predicted toxin-antitoxin system
VIRFLVDEDFNNDLVRGLLRRSPGVDLLRVQDLDLRGATDEAVLARAASEGRVVLTHDVSTLIAQAYHRVRVGQRMPGVIAVSQTSPVGQVIEDLLLVVECSTPEDWTNLVRYIPLR